MSCTKHPLSDDKGIFTFHPNLDDTTRFIQFSVPSRRKQHWARVPLPMDDFSVFVPVGIDTLGYFRILLQISVTSLQTTICPRGVKQIFCPSVG